MKKWVSCCVVFFAVLAVSAQRPAKPNFVILLADDLGWQDVGCYDVDANAVYFNYYSFRSRNVMVAQSGVNTLIGMGIFQ